ncbi:MAG TPA: cytosine permease [Jatrophihabitans sp.]|jgi:putative hydroxymethylpyrimidine transporter CytX|uniref:purine-cytosine permease family protein n=1 Tax=Jatrophihabitans sp. TaxID=1932789 RepID=UPI002F019FE9
MAVDTRPDLSTDRHAEAPTTLNEAAPRTLGLLDQLGFWGNVGVSLLGFSGAIAILAPYGVQPLSFPAAVAAAVLGSVLGGLILGGSLVLGARTGAPAMVLLRGLLGAKASFVPTALNIAQCLGWAVFELVIISTGLQALTSGDLPRWLCLVLAGAVTTALTIRPLGWIRALRKYVSVLVIAALVILTIGLLRQPVPELAGSWQGFWLAVDSAMALTISWVPLGADYSRHSRSSRAAFAGGFLGYGLAQIACLVIGLIALAQVAQDGSRIFDLFIGLPLGALAFAILVIRETDQSFANVYSTAVSLQNLRPSLDRRVLTVLIGGLTTALALTINIDDYANFLYLIGAVFIPMSGALIAAWIRSGGRGWNTAEDAPARPGMLLAWLIGFLCYQLINPGSIVHWSDFWTWAGTRLHTLSHPWLSASIASFVVAVLVALPFAGGRPADDRPAPARAEESS